eukprot:scaffold57774_cov21-Prasinocladus_malaysianus.AAC.1
MDEFHVIKQHWLKWYRSYSGIKWDRLKYWKKAYGTECGLKGIEALQIIRCRDCVSIHPGAQADEQTNTKN